MMVSMLGLNVLVAILTLISTQTRCLGSAQSDSEECSWEGEAMPSAVVFGATGAIGTQLWQQLAASGTW